MCFPFCCDSHGLLDALLGNRGGLSAAGIFWGYPFFLRHATAIFLGLYPRKRDKTGCYMPVRGRSIVQKIDRIAASFDL